MLRAAPEPKQRTTQSYALQPHSVLTKPAAKASTAAGTASAAGAAAAGAAAAGAALGLKLRPKAASASSSCCSMACRFWLTSLSCAVTCAAVERCEKLEALVANVQFLADLAQLGGDLQGRQGNRE